MIDPQYFDKRGLEGDVSKGVQMPLFARYCLSEFALENYIALFCIMAFKKRPSVDLLLGFIEAFLGPMAPMELNGQNRESQVKTSLQTALHSGQAPETLIAGALDRVFDDVQGNLVDTYSRFQPQVHGRQAKYDFMFKKKGTGGANASGLLPFRRNQRHVEYVKKLQDMKSNDADVKAGLRILADAGYPVHKMGLTGIVDGW